MNEEAFNLSTRTFLKQFGIGAQREIEKAVDEGIRTGKLKGAARIKVGATLRIAGLGERFVLEGEISLV